MLRESRGSPLTGDGLSKAEQTEAAGVGAAVPEQMAIAASGRRAGPQPEFPKRASWLRASLQERSWNKHDLARQGGPDHKTVQKILDGFPVREDVLGKVVAALAKKGGKPTALDIPTG
jgi:hypothetical protein